MYSISKCLSISNWVEMKIIGSKKYQHVFFFYIKVFRILILLCFLIVDLKIEEGFTVVILLF